MITVHVHLQAQDSSEWKKMLKKQMAVQKKFGCKGGQVYHDEESPEDIYMILRWDSKENAERYMEDADVQALMFETLSDMPEIAFIGEEYEIAI